MEDDDVDMLPEVHVHGLRLHAGQQRRPIPLRMPLPTIPPSLRGEPLDAWMRVRFLVKATGEATMVVLEPTDHRELTLAAVDVLERWTFLPQMDGDTPVDGELTVKIHFRTP
ncbi:MAG: TonB family protein [Nitrospirae bacterium]|nr:MAG: TonB family protein [Nitrospirota bacterium]